MPNEISDGDQFSHRDNAISGDFSGFPGGFQWFPGGFQRNLTIVFIINVLLSHRPPPREYPNKDFSALRCMRATANDDRLYHIYSIYSVYRVYAYPKQLSLGDVDAVAETQLVF